MPDTTHSQKSGSAAVRQPASSDQSREEIIPAVDLSTPSALTSGQIMSLQRSIGNRNTMQLLQRSAAQPQSRVQRSVPKTIQRALKTTSSALSGDERVKQVDTEVLKNITSALEVYEKAVEENKQGQALVPLLTNIQTACSSLAQNEAVAGLLKEVDAEKDQLVVDQLAILRGLTAKQLGEVRGTGKLPDNVPQDIVPFLISTLQQMAPSKDDVNGTLTKREDPNNAQGKSMSIEHIYERSKTQDENLRVVRFVKSSKMNGGFAFGDVDYQVTSGGYVTYGSAGSKAKKADIVKSRKQISESRDARTRIVSGVADTMSNAKWCYDGPHKENISQVGTKLINEDSPGQTAPTGQTFDAIQYPFVISTEFVLVVYNQDTGRIVDVKMFKDCLAAWTKDDRKTSPQPDASLI